MAERKTLFDDPAFEKTQIVIYLANTLSLKQLLVIEDLAKTGKIKKITGETIHNEEQEQSNESIETTKPGKTIGGLRLRFTLID